MKKTLAKTLRSVLSLVLALVMVLGTVGTTFAAQPSVDAESAVAKLVDVLGQYGPDVVAEARNYVESHGYVKAVKEAASNLKAALEECAAEHDLLVAAVEKLLAGPKAQLAELKAEAEDLVFLIALYKSGAFNVSAEAAAVITIPGFGTIDTDKIDTEKLEDFEISDLTPEQKEAIENSGLIGDVKLDELTDEQVGALKDAGLKGEINPEVFTEEQLKDLQNAQTQLNETIETIEKTEAKVNALEAKLAEMKAEINALYEAAKNTEDLSQAIINVLKEGSVMGAKLAAEKYVAARDSLFAVLENIEKPYTHLDDLAIDLVNLTLDVCTEMKNLTVFVAKDVLNTVKNNKLLFAGAFVVAAGAVGVSQESLVLIAEQVQRFAPIVAEKVSTAINNLKALAYKAYKNATTDDLFITYGTNYVAIGDDAAAADNSYADLLNAELQIPVDVDKSMAVEGIMIQDLELDAEAIANAELITLGFSVSNFAGSIADAALGAEVNWAAYLPEEGVAAVNAVMNEMNLYIEALGFTGFTADTLVAAVETIAFNSLAYAYCLPKTIAAIREINEDAVLVVVGLDNALENAVVSHGERTLGIDKLMDGIVALTDLYTLCYAILASNCTFVAAPNAANDAEGSVITVNNLASTMLGNGLLPNAEGQKYIQKRIYEALNVSYGFLWGDANLDAVVDYKDAMIILQYSIDLPVHGDFIYLPVCNVDGQNGLNYRDSMRVLQKSIKLIDKFEVEK